MAHVFTLANAKVGCGETTVALNLAICFARARYRTLAIDLDRQGNFSAGLGVALNKVSLTFNGASPDNLLSVGGAVRLPP
jgi:cellulose biosynthesis protein BcsQ